MDIKLLSGNPLFKDIDEDILRELVGSETCVIETYKKGTIIVQAGAVFTSIGFVLYGMLATQHINADGDLSICLKLMISLELHCIKLKSLSIRLLWFH